MPSFTQAFGGAANLSCAELLNLTVTLQSTIRYAYTSVITSVFCREVMERTPTDELRDFASGCPGCKKSPLPPFVTCPDPIKVLSASFGVECHTTKDPRTCIGKVIATELMLPKCQGTSGKPENCPNQPSCLNGKYLPRSVLGGAWDNYSATVTGSTWVNEITPSLNPPWATVNNRLYFCSDALVSQTLFWEWDVVKDANTGYYSWYNFVPWFAVQVPSTLKLVPWISPAVVLKLFTISGAPAVNPFYQVQVLSIAYRKLLALTVLKCGAPDFVQAAQSQNPKTGPTNWYAPIPRSEFVALGAAITGLAATPIVCAWAEKELNTYFDGSPVPDAAAYIAANFKGKGKGC